MKNNKKMSAAVNAEESNKNTENVENTNKDQNKEVEMDTNKEQVLQAAITNINGWYQICKDGEQAAAEIGRQLLKIEEEELYTFDTDEKGASITSMAAFIKKNFEFSYNYGVMVKQSAKVERILDHEHKLDLSFSLLRALNRYGDKEEAVKTIWGNAKESGKKSVPTHNGLKQAIKNWEEDHPEDAWKGKAATEDWDKILNSTATTLKAICRKLATIDPKTIDEGTKGRLIEKIKALLESTPTESMGDTENEEMEANDETAMSA